MNTITTKERWNTNLLQRLGHGSVHCFQSRLSAKFLKNGTPKTYKGFPHGMPTTEAATINADILAFIKS